MIEQLGQVMLYVEDQEQSKKFWTEKLGFTVISDINNGMRIITVAPKDEAQTSIVLHDKKKIEEMSPELNLSTPSLMFYAQNLEELYEDFKAKGITVGEFMKMPFGKVFNFADDEENYFAVMEK
ncbi:VOC family protein [Solibacillus isronensis]|uniref:VOC family protein n=1 Tax=Solibacillus isronensis TaxID=412383 RepID=UPI00203C2856|nr:VOC family protein [Solibacillus isronensis]MCM3720557.1 VOC family protein [Solibacillus isronensis]